MNYQVLNETFINPTREGFRRLCRLCDIVAADVVDLSIINNQNPAFIELKILFKNGDSDSIKLVRKNYQGIIYL